jgi:hypothetical protein
MLSRPSRPVAAATIVIVSAFAAPPAAIAGGGGGGKGKCTASACSVYTEPVPSAGKKQVQQNRTGGTTKPVPISHRAERTLAHAGKDKKLLTQLLTNPGYGASRGLESSAAGVVAPSALGAAFDLGSGPTALFAILAGTALAVAVYAGMGSWRRRRPNP